MGIGSRFGPKLLLRGGKKRASIRSSARSHVPRLAGGARRPVAAEGREASSRPLRCRLPAPAEKLPGDLPAFQGTAGDDRHHSFTRAMATRVPSAGGTSSSLMAITDVRASGIPPFGRCSAASKCSLVDNMLRKFSRRGRLGGAQARAWGDDLSRLLLPSAQPPAGSIRRSVRFLTEIMRHHIGLVAPKALLIFRRQLFARPARDADDPRSPWRMAPGVTTPDGRIPAIVTIRPQGIAGPAQSSGPMPGPICSCSRKKLKP